MAEYYKLGARFTKWRAVYNISEIYPSELAIKANAHALARYAALVQEAKMVPIIEPEVLMDGKHDINKCYEVTVKVLKECSIIEIKQGPFIKTLDKKRFDKVDEKKIKIKK